MNYKILVSPDIVIGADTPENVISLLKLLPPNSTAQITTRKENVGASSGPLTVSPLAKSQKSKKPSSDAKVSDREFDQKLIVLFRQIESKNGLSVPDVLHVTGVKSAKGLGGLMARMNKRFKGDSVLGGKDEIITKSKKGRNVLKWMPGIKLSYALEYLKGLAG